MTTVDTRFEVGSVFYYLDDGRGHLDTMIMTMQLDRVDVTFCGASRPLITYWAHRYYDSRYESRAIQNNDMMFKTKDEAYEAYLKLEKAKAKTKEDAVKAQIAYHERELERLRRETNG